jgi:hypothetical protein
VRFTCATCGKEIAPEEGTLSWRQVDGKLSGFRITHKTDQNQGCNPEDVAYVHLWILTGLTGFVKYAEHLASLWAKGYVLADEAGLKKALSELGMHLWENSRKNQ